MKYYKIINKEKKGEIVIDGLIGSSWFEDGVDGKQFREDFKKLEEKYNDIDIRILSSPGGFIDEGLTIFRVIRDSEKNTTVYIDSMAASMAAIISLAGDRLFIAKQAKFMLHKASGGAIGNSDDLRATADLMESYEQDFVDILKEKTGRSEKFINENWITKTDKWFDAKELKREKIADGIFDNGKILDKKSNFSFGKKFNIAAYYNDKQKNIEMENLKMLNEAAGLKPDASESDLYKRIVELTNLASKVQTLETENKTLKTEKEEIQNSQKGFVKERATALIENAITDGKLSFDSDEDKQKMISDAEKSYDSVKTIIDSIPGKKPGEKKETLKNFFENNETSKTDSKILESKTLAEEWDRLSKNNQLKDVKKNDPDRYIQLYEARFGCKPTIIEPKENS